MKTSEIKAQHCYDVTTDQENGKFVFFYNESYLELICNTSYGVFSGVWINFNKPPLEFFTSISRDEFFTKISNNIYVISNEEQENYFLSLIEDNKSTLSKSIDTDALKNNISDFCFSGIFELDEFKELIATEFKEFNSICLKSDFKIFKVYNPYLILMYDNLIVPLIDKIKSEKPL